jgi:phosphatidylinositol alpha-1,6-mannosyltransferase
MTTLDRSRLLVLTIDSPPSVGGIQRFIHELGHILAPRWEVSVLAPFADGSVSYDQDVPFRVIRTRSGWERSRGRVLAEMTRLAWQTPADVVLAAHANTLIPLVAAGRGRPLAAMVYGSELWAQRTRLMTRALGPRLGLVMAISNFTAIEAVEAGIPAERIVVTPLGAALAARAPGEQSVLRNLGLVTNGEVTPYFLTVARLAEPHKGQDTMIRALPSLLRADSRVRYVIAGEGPLAQSLSGLAESLGVGHAVHLAGPVDETSKGALLRNCRAFVMSSREMQRPPLFEGFGIAYLEAALGGRPSLAGRSGGTPDAVVDGETGVLVDPISVPQLTEAALRLLEDANYADRLGSRARERALADFTWERAVARMERCLESILP